MSREAMKLALEFLSHDMVAEDWPHQKRKDAVCDALRAALAEPEQDELRRLHALNTELVEALRCADAMLSGANMDAKAVELKVAAALAKAGEE